MRTSIDIDDEAMKLAAEELGTSTKVATVNAALRRIAEQRASRLMMDDLLGMDLDLDEGRGDHEKGVADGLPRRQVRLGMGTAPCQC